ncbi:hypothetical protein LOC54_09120 [Acetobacter sp. AN02]|uniref:hypothetical protein n=1 Tax=Acetobacter sp. AN02 TaxID=2894186 RepID=UPI0024341CFA|nr:hypothetical protein [Acetobacter sp. AN02]MDG6095262.1 hypothetical protein [Acetobacter sp. AN02]
MKTKAFFFSSAVSIAFKNAPFKSLILWTFPEISPEVRDVKKGIFSPVFPIARHFRHFPKGFWLETLLHLSSILKHMVNIYVPFFLIQLPATSR